ncbi:MAG: helix-turn-helix domain-containing protein [Acidimicrobiales bacterium]|nr:helix-turn-helix domain-containing protein [Acidimicrobiales bacterium]MYA26069.1 helix-turn-helix domain-containing protein [Acidimicrobiales bacterium]MYD84166.1 helix-turn-helix domain-containing protein [Acidimicrobiales bacterium]MYI28493.1 helix-turn-helix domain-containing protein [Acidimicrobiales bacterium]MYJ64138.1 helix-turn-helix domain-containing protein [Acidimicrobiales bacterium]
MEPIGIASAARQLEISSRRVHQLVSAGQLSGHQIGRSWVLDRAEVQRFARSRPAAGRPWSPSSAWNVLALADGNAVRGSPVDRSRARKRLQVGLEPLAKRLSSRAQSRWFYAHPAAHSEMLSYPDVVASGVSALNAHHVDLIVSDQAEAYVPQSRVSELADRFALDADSDRPNIRLRVVSDDDWPFEADQRVAPAPVVAVDLLDADDERSQRAARGLLARCTIARPEPAPT